MLLTALSVAFAPPANRTTIDVHGREVALVMPACTATRAAVPLVVSFHAWGTTASFQEQHVDRFPEVSGAGCFAFAYPQGLQRAWGAFGLAGYSWNAGGCCPNANDDKVDDVQFVSALVALVRARFSVVDRSLLFVAGVSNGGMMVNRLACELDGVTAMASISGPLINGTDFVGVPFQCDRSLPILHIHGHKDPIVPFGGCNSTWASYGFECIGLHKMHPIANFPAVEQYIDDWRSRNGVMDAAPTLGFSNGTVGCQSWGDKAAHNVTLCVAADEGHAWPGSTSFCMLPPARCTLDMDASRHILEFFNRSSVHRSA